MDITTEHYETLKELIELNQTEDFLTEEVVHFVKGLIESYEENALNNIG